MDKPNYTGNKQIKESITWHQANQEISDKRRGENAADFKFLFNIVLQL